MVLKFLLIKSSKSELFSHLEKVYHVKSTVAIGYVHTKPDCSLLRYRNRAEITVSYVWTEVLSGVVFVPAQKLSGDSENIALIITGLWPYLPHEQSPEKEQT